LFFFHFHCLWRCPFPASHTPPTQREPCLASLFSSCHRSGVESGNNGIRVKKICPFSWDPSPTIRDRDKGLYRSTQASSPTLIRVRATALLRLHVDLGLRKDVRHPGSKLAVTAVFADSTKREMVHDAPHRLWYLTRVEASRPVRMHNLPYTQV
jgi:hypothetical protein